MHAITLIGNLNRAIGHGDMGSGSLKEIVQDGVQIWAQGKGCFNIEFTDRADLISPVWWPWVFFRSVDFSFKVVTIGFSLSANNLNPLKYS